MSHTTPTKDSLVLYKNHAARVNQTGDKLEIEVADGRTVRVRPKDVQALHPGPIRSLRDLTAQTGEVVTAWELLAGESISLADLADLIYGEYTPATAWAAWELVTEGLYFQGTPELVTARTEAELAQEQADRAAKAAEQQAWTDFLNRAGAGQFSPEDERYLREVEEVALGRQQTSRVLKELGRAETPESAHTFLLKLEYWDETRNPYPERFGIITTSPALPAPELPAEERRDLTDLPAFAIDDEGSEDPDDAISLVDGRLWVHIADAAALVEPDSALDREARARGANLYLPEQTIHMLPPEVTTRLGLGLADLSPALSCGLDLTPDGQVSGLEIVPSWVRVQRMTYAEAEAKLAEEPLRSLNQLARRSMDRRRINGSAEIDLPEVRVRVWDGEIDIRPIRPLRSRDLVREAMLLCGQALAEFAQENEIPFLFSVQEPPFDHEQLEGLAGMFALRKAMQPSRRQGDPAPHSGLGLPIYSQATSPLRRYSDLLVHQQLRAFMRGQPLLSSREIMLRISEAEVVGGNVRQAERLANRHWTLVYLLRHPEWQGDGVVVEQRGRRSLVLVPEFDLDVRMRLPVGFELNSIVPLQINGASLASLSPHFLLLDE